MCPIVARCRPLHSATIVYANNAHSWMARMKGSRVANEVSCNALLQENQPLPFLPNRSWIAKTIIISIRTLHITLKYDVPFPVFLSNLIIKFFTSTICQIFITFFYNIIWHTCLKYVYIYIYYNVIHTRMIYNIRILYNTKWLTWTYIYFSLLDASFTYSLNS